MREAMVSKHKNTNKTGAVKPAATNPVKEGDAGDWLARGRNAAFLGGQRELWKGGYLEQGRPHRESLEEERSRKMD